MRIRRWIDALLGMTQFHHFECQRWWAMHVTHDAEKAETAGRLARTIRHFYSLPRDLQDKIAATYVPAIDEALGDDER